MPNLTFRDYKMNPGHSDAPVHFISEKSLEDLKLRVNNPDVEVSRAQFKPNMVVRGTVAYEEDNMREMIITPTGSDPVVLNIFKHCLRCRQTSFNYKKSSFDEFAEPYTTLRKYRTYGTIGIAFGMYALTDSEAVISVGDTVTYTKKTSKPIVFDS